MGIIDDPLPWKREATMSKAWYLRHEGRAHMAYYVSTPRAPRQDVETSHHFLYVPEEEVGSPTSQAMIEDEAKKHKYVLVTEPARDGNKCVTERKGAARFEIRTTGRQAHSGLRHQDGRSAILEMARQIVDIEAMTDYEKGITLNVGEIQGGTGVNVVPGDCVIGVDLRMLQRRHSPRNTWTRS